jgi:hypothetical protein
MRSRSPESSVRQVTPRRGSGQNVLGERQRRGHGGNHGRAACVHDAVEIGGRWGRRWRRDEIGERWGCRWRRDEIGHKRAGAAGLRGRDHHHDEKTNQPHETTRAIQLTN